MPGLLIGCLQCTFLVTVNFFDDIHIPANALQEPSRFDEKEQLWVWSFEDHDLFMDIGEEIRFRVTAETFTDTSPTGPEGRPLVLAKRYYSRMTSLLLW